MKNFLQLAAGVDVLPLLHAIKRRPELWKEDTYLRDYPQGPFGEVETIMLRFPVKGVYETEEELKNHLSTYDPHECIDYPPYKILHEARPLIMSLMSRVGGERLGRCMINKVAPGGRIFPHIDTKSHTDYYSRHHIVLETNPDSVFRSGDEAPMWRQGDVFWFDNAQEHEVQNRGATDRIHLVVDIRCSARA